MAGGLHTPGSALACLLDAPVGAGVAPGHSRNQKDREAQAGDSGAAALHNYKKKKKVVFFPYICRNKVAMD